MSESENFNRLVRILARGGTMVLRKLLEKYSAPLSFADFIYQNQAIILKLKFYENQRLLVVGRDLDKMDITLLGKFALGLFKDKMTAKEKDCVNKIKEERDNIMHSDMLETAKINATFFNRKWQEITNILLDIADEIGPQVKVDLQTLIKVTNKCCPELAEIYKILLEWCQSSKELEQKIGGLTAKVDSLTGKMALSMVYKK